MRIAQVVVSLLAVAMVLSGCGHSNEVENQAYALVFGVDMYSGGSLELTICIPRIGSSGDSGKANTGGGDYLVFSAKGDGYAQALEHLQWSVPRELNLSHIKLLVVSETLAEQASFANLINRIAETPHLYTAARLVVCEGSARDFIDDQEIIIGTRLSNEIEAMFEHYAEHGYVPDAVLADVYYGCNSIYSDPMAILGFVSGEGSSEQPAIAMAGASATPDMLGVAPSDRRYMGAAVFRNGVLSHRMGARETIMTSLIAGHLETLTIDLSGMDYTLTLERKPKRRVRILGEAVTVSIEVWLSGIDNLSNSDARVIELTLEEAMLETVRACQAARVEPFGFAEKAAMQFASVPDWLAFDWRERFSRAEVEIKVHLACAAVL